MLVQLCKNSNCIIFLYSCEYRYGFHAVFKWIQCGFHIVFLWIQVWTSFEYRYGEFTGIQYRILTVKTVNMYYNYVDPILYSRECRYKFYTIFLWLVFLWIQIWIAYCIPVNTEMDCLLYSCEYSVDSIWYGSLEYG